MSQLIKKILLYSSIFVVLIGAAYLSAGSANLALLSAILLAIATIILIKISKNPFWGFLLIVFFLPFERVPSYNAGFMNIKINQIFASITMLFWLMSLLFNREKIKSNILAIPMVIFSLIAFLSIWQAELISRSLQVFIFTIFTIALSVLTINLVDCQDRLAKVIKVLLVSTLLVCGFAIFQFLGDVIGLSREITLLKKGYDKGTLGYPRVQAFSMEPLYLANYLFIPLGVAWALLMEKINFIKRSYLFYLIGLILLIIILTVSRGAYIGLLAMILFLAIFQAKKIFSWKNIITGLLIVIFVLGGVFLAMNKANPQALEKYIEHVQIKDLGIGESTESRLKAWYDAYRAFEEKPYLGIGIGNFGAWVKGYPDPSSQTGWDIVNNEYLEILAEMGILGLFSFILLIVVLLSSSFIALKRAKDPFLRAVLLGLLAAFVATLVQYNFFSTLYIMHIWVLIGLIIAVQNLCFRNHINKITITENLHRKH